MPRDAIQAALQCKAVRKLLAKHVEKGWWCTSPVTAPEVVRLARSCLAIGGVGRRSWCEDALQRASGDP